ncbi:tetratricopeptide repeat protein [Reichenbachiella sp. MALMAid0571]|uniref:ATP-binding protein n=1 Tax=Reichenbachiella sp. MALMAid0571 TaxID=3143939 RepID=UPI0032E01E9E
MGFIHIKTLLITILAVLAISSHVFSLAKLDSLFNELSTSNASGRAAILAEIANAYYYSDIEKVKIYLDSAIVEVDTENDKIVLAKIYHYYGDYYDRIANQDSAIFFYNKSVNLNRLIGEQVGIAKGVSRIGLMYYKSGNYDLASKHFFDAVQIAEKTDDSRTIAVCYGYLGHLFYSQKNFEDALRYQKLTRKLHIEDNDMRDAATASVNIGNAFHQLKQYDSALYYLNSALDQFILEKDTLAQSYPYNNMALVYNDRKQHHKSIEYLQKGLDIRIKYKEPRGVCFGYNFIGLNYQELGDYKKAIENYKKSVENAIPINYVLLLKSSYEGLSACYDSLKQFKEAYEYQKLTTVLADTLFTREKTQELAEAQTKFETEKKEQQIIAQDLIIAEEKAVNQRNLAIIFGLILCLVLIVVLVLFQRNRMRKKQQLALQQKDLEYQEQQLNAIIDSQEKERSRFASDLHDGFGQLISILKLNVESIASQKDMEKRSSIYDKSISILNEMYGELKNICFNLMPQSLLKLGLEASLKEFADKINASEKLMVDVMVFDLNERLTGLQEISIYRIVQEWVNNIIKYSDAQKVTIQLTKDEGEITLTIEDDGMGFEISKLTESKGNGWKNIRSRTNLIHGDLEVDTTVNQRGTLFSINIPVVIETESVPSPA